VESDDTERESFFAGSRADLQDEGPALGAACTAEANKEIVLEGLAVVSLALGVRSELPRQLPIVELHGRKGSIVGVAVNEYEARSHNGGWGAVEAHEGPGALTSHQVASVQGPATGRVADVQVIGVNTDEDSIAGIVVIEINSLPQLLASNGRVRSDDVGVRVEGRSGNDGVGSNTVVGVGISLPQSGAILNGGDYEGASSVSRVDVVVVEQTVVEGTDVLPSSVANGEELVQVLVSNDHTSSVGDVQVATGTGGDDGGRGNAG